MRFALIFLFALNLTAHADEMSPASPTPEKPKAPETLSEVTVVSERSPDRISKSVITGKQLKKVAGSSGDPLTGLQALPGVVSGGMGSVPAVRGSGPGDNAYYVDSLPSGNIFHFGGISVFNADLIKDFNLFSAAFAPHYADVTGAIIDVALRDPRSDRLGGKVNVNLLGADALIEAPITENQSFYFAARRSYIDLFLKQVEQEGVTVQIPNYSDYQGKYILKVGDSSNLTFQMQGSSDTLRLKIGGSSDIAQKDPILAGNFAFDNNNSMQALVFDSVVFDRAFNKLALEHMKFDFTNTLGGAGNLYLAQDSWMLRESMFVPINEGHELALSANYERALVKIDADLKNATCTQFNPACDTTSATRAQLKDQFYSNGWDVSAQDRKRVASRVTLVTGVRYSHEDYLRKAYTEPRLGVEWETAPDTLLTAGWGKHNQMPTGQQVAKTFGNPLLAHLRADHLVLGVSHKLDALWSWKSEAYYKKFDGLIVDEPLLNYVNGASGKAYGLEFLLKKNPGEPLSGWFALSLSKSLRRNDLTGESFRFELDQPINATLVTTYLLNDDWTVGAKWTAHSGTPYTPIYGTNGTFADGRPKPNYAAINSGTLPFYHRLDVRLERELKMDGYTLEMYFEWNNLYGQKNIDGYSYDPTYTEKKPVYPFVLPISFGVQAEF